MDALASAVGDAFGVPRPVIVHVCRVELAKARAEIDDGGEPNVEAAVRDLLTQLDTSQPKRVINATGVLLHTNLGRAVVEARAASFGASIAAGASNVEIDVSTGRRAKRHTYLGALLASMTGAEAAHAVNNNAGALLLAMSALAGPGGRVAVSRGELVEIGGSFRLPELMRANGVELVEVGTTNRTRLSDYERVIDSVDFVLKVHPSNFRIDGFTEEVSYADLCELASASSTPVVADVGSGLIDAEAPWLGTAARRWLDGEPGVKQTLEAGVDLVLFSGDKLFGGPQAGIIVGKEPLVSRLATNPVARALRLDGSSIATLAETAAAYLDQRVLDIPFWAMAALAPEEVGDRASAVARGIPGTAVVDGESLPGAGSVPGATIPTKVIRIEGDADRVWKELASGPGHVIGSRKDGATHLDLRSVIPEDDAVVRAGLERIAR